MPQRGRRNADEMLLMALACGATVEAAAAKAGISKVTAKRRLADPEFQNRLKEFKSDMVQRAAATLTAAGSESVKTLVVLQQSSVPHAVRLGAAKATIELGIKMREVTDLEARLAALEQQMAMNTPP
jgi:hypothetical protein